MANEATVTSILSVFNTTTKIQFTSAPGSFKADVTASFGPAPGAMTATVAGADVDLSMFTQPSLCRIMNLDTANYVTIGIWDGTTLFPLHELLAGESYVFRIPRAYDEERGTGTGTITSDINTIRAKADTAACAIVFEAFEV